MSSKRLRFEIFKRDKFTCRYCGRKSPEIILELDHIIPRKSNGSNDEMNLVTSCFDCNRGKADINLSELITGEDPHDRAIELLERERQLAEYYKVRREVEKRIASEIKIILEHYHLSDRWGNSIRAMLQVHNFYDVCEAINIGIHKKGRYVEYSPYVWGILRNITNGQNTRNQT